MKQIQILDCTLRDGGYCNNWKFGNENAKLITSRLVKAGIDIVECGFLTNRVDYHPDITRFNSIDQMNSIIPEEKEETMFVAMINYGEYDVDSIPEYKESFGLEGLRIAFHKKDVQTALEFAGRIKEKGYKVFIQAMVSLRYTDEEFLSLIHKVNELKPYAFYIVDSFGMMKGKDLTRLFYVVEHNLDQGIKIGFHSHNNLQLAFSNAQTLLGLQTNRSLIIDSSVYGMGRGAGNLNTELFVEHLNNTVGTAYAVKPLLEVIDKVLNHFYEEKPWGYSLPNYLSAQYEIHPNYADYLDNKKTLTVEDMDEIFMMLDKEKAVSFDKQYIESAYEKYMEKGTALEIHRQELEEKISGHEILVIAPGHSILVEEEKIKQFASSRDLIKICINFDYNRIPVDFIFVSNLRRFRSLDPACHERCIVTSNIPSGDVYAKYDYAALLNDHDMVRDNAGMMLISLLYYLRAGKVFIAGMDGYSPDSRENYADPKMNFMKQSVIMEAMNQGMEKVLADYAQRMEICFITGTKLHNIDKCHNAAIENL